MRATCIRSVFKRSRYCMLYNLLHSSRDLPFAMDCMYVFLVITTTPIIISLNSINQLFFLKQNQCNMCINQQDARNSCDQTLFSITCSTCFGLCQSTIRSSFISCTSHLVYAGTIRLAVVWLQPHLVYADTKCDVQLIKLLLMTD